MIRVKFTHNQSISYFNKVLNCIDRKSLCHELNISTRTLRDWIRIKHRPTLHALEYINHTYDIPIPTSVEKQDTLIEKSISGRKGGIERFKKHGSFATKEGRILGGMNSIKSHITLQTNFQTSVTYPTPSQSAQLAEYIGIVIGDGYVSNNQICIYLNKIDDSEYIKYVTTLIFNLYTYQPSITFHKTKKLVTIRISSVCIVNTLKGHGISPGNKITHQTNFPSWITESLLIVPALRGLFDTDGSIYQDKHRTKTKLYLSLAVAFTIYNESLYKQVYGALLYLGFHPTVSTPRRILLRINHEVHLFFSIIQPANKKHLRRYQQFTRRSN